MLFIKSIIIGICALLPGVSGSVIAVTFGIYDKFISIISDIKKIKENKLFLFIVLIGIFLGIFCTSKLLIIIFKYKVIIYCSLVGIILSEIPFIIKKIHNYTKSGIMFIPTLLSFFLSLLLDVLNRGNAETVFSTFNYFIGGVLFSFGKVFPGVSSSFFLLCLGIYEDIVVIVTNPLILIDNFYYYIPFMIGTIFGLLVFFKLLSYLMNNHFRLIYSIILGFILSSIIVLYPGFRINANYIIGNILMILFFFFFIILKRKNDI